MINIPSWAGSESVLAGLMGKDARELSQEDKERLRDELEAGAG